MVQVQLGFNMIDPQTCTSEPNSIYVVIESHVVVQRKTTKLYQLDWAVGYMWQRFIPRSLQEDSAWNVPQAQAFPKERESKGSEHQKKKRHVYVMKRKLNATARVRALEEKQPVSSRLPKLREEVSLLCYSIQEGLVEKLNSRERKAVNKIKENPKFFFSSAKRLQKTRSTIPVLRDETGRI